MAKALVEHETIDSGQIDDLMERKKMRVAEAIVDSDVVSEELGKGASSVNPDDSDDQPMSGSGKEQLA
jgi:cell division protease FtsH